MKLRRTLLTVGILAGLQLAVAEHVLAATPCPPPVMTVDAANAVNTTCTAGIAYLSSASPFEVKQLAGALAPTNGKSTLQSVTPAEWLNSDPGTNDGNVVDFWSGGIGDPAASKVYVIGGGHHNSANNGIYSYDFTGTTAPTGFALVAGSQSTIANTPSANSQTYTTYNDGKASSRHTYDGVSYIDGKIYVMGGSHYDSGYMGPLDTWRFQNGTWTKLADGPQSNVERPSSALDPVSKKVLVWCPGASQYSFFNTATETWSSAKSLSGSYATQDVTLGYDTLRGRVVMFGSGLNGVWTVNFSNETITAVSTHPVSGILGNPGITPLYDASRDVFWILGGRGSDGSSGYSTLYEMNASTFAVTSHPLTGDAIAVSSDNWGSFKRAVLLNKAIGFVSSFNSPAYAIKLP